MRAPGAFHRARFLAKALYILKMAMLADVLTPAVIPHRQQRNAVDQIDRMATFIALFYGRYFLQCRLPTVAPRTDLCFWKDMCILQVNYDLIYLKSFLCFKCLHIGWMVLYSEN